jgi:hypothetical protein
MLTLELTHGRLTRTKVSLSYFSDGKNYLANNNYPFQAPMMLLSTIAMSE